MARLDFKHHKILYASAILVCISADRDASKLFSEEEQKLL